MSRFTDRTIAALRPRPARYEAWEGGGFGIRVSPRGGKAWVWVYHFDGKSRRLTLGSYPEIGLADAHVRLADARKQLAQGIDPGERAVARRKVERAAETVASWSRNTSKSGRGLASDPRPKMSGSSAKT